MIETLIRRTISPKWSFTKSGVAGVYLQNGLLSLASLYGVSEVDDERIVDYIVYQIYRQVRYISNGSWNYTFLFSTSALDRFRRQFMSVDGKSGINYYIDQWLDEAELNRGQLLAMIAKPKPNPLRSMVYLDSEEPIKERFLNTEDGLLLCQATTTGWSPLSPTCKKCDNWEECGKMTAKKFPELMRFRKEVYYGRKEK